MQNVLKHCDWSNTQSVCLERFSRLERHCSFSDVISLADLKVRLRHIETDKYGQCERPRAELRINIKRELTEKHIVQRDKKIDLDLTHRVIAQSN